eukprot:scaffold1486_cov329-Prasinococcus_capsulatus_cf.AAC.18
MLGEGVDGEGARSLQVGPRPPYDGAPLCGSQLPQLHPHPGECPEQVHGRCWQDCCTASTRARRHDSPTYRSLCSRKLVSRTSMSRPWKAWFMAPGHSQKSASTTSCCSFCAHRCAGAGHALHASGTGSALTSKSDGG